VAVPSLTIATRYDALSLLAALPRDQAADATQETLEYDCTCSNGTAPGLEYYIQTMPTVSCVTRELHSQEDTRD